MAAATLPGMRRLLYVNSVLVLVIGIPLFLFSDRPHTSSACTIPPPLTAAALGAAYWASFVLELLSARERLWARTRVAVPAVLLFSTLTLAITLVHADRFHFHSPRLITRAGTWVWLGVYVSVPLAMRWLLVAQQRQARPDPARVAPLAPWARVPLTSRAIGAWAVGIGTIAAPDAWENDWWRLRPTMLSHTLLGVLQVSSVLRYPADLDRSRLAAVVYVLFLATILLLGGYGCWKTRHARRANG